MRFVKRRRGSDTAPDPLEDPISGVANLFDVALAFIVALLIAVFSSLNMLDMLDPTSSVTVVKQNEDGEMEIITKEREEITVQRVTDRELSGAGVRLGTAYRLDDGRVVYVPEGESPPGEASPIGATPDVPPAAPPPAAAP